MNSTEAKQICTGFRFEKISNCIDMEEQLCPIIMRLNEDSLEEMLDFYFNVANKKRVKLEYTEYEDDDFFRKYLIKEENNYYARCEDEFETWYDLFVNINLKNFILGTDKIKLEDDNDLYNLDGYPSFPYPAQIAAMIIEDIYNQGLTIMDFDIYGYIAHLLNQNTALKIEWLRIYYDDKYDYVDFLNRFKVLVEIHLKRNFIKVFNRGSKYQDGFTNQKLVKEKAILSEPMIASYILNLNDDSDVSSRRRGFKYKTLVDLEELIKEKIDIYSLNELEANGIYKRKSIKEELEYEDLEHIYNGFDFKQKSHSIMYILRHKNFLTLQECKNFNVIEHHSNRIMVVDFEFDKLYDLTEDELINGEYSRSTVRRLLKSGIRINSVDFDDIENVNAYIKSRNIINKSKYKSILKL